MHFFAHICPTKSLVCSNGWSAGSGGSDVSAVVCDADVHGSILTVSIDFFVVFFFTKNLSFLARPFSTILSLVQNEPPTILS